MLFEDFAAAYCAAVADRLRSAERVRFVMARWVRHFAGRDLTSIRRADIAAFIRVRRAAVGSANTVNVDLATLSAAFNYARRIWELDIINPVAGQLLRSPEGRLRYLTQAEAARLLEAAASLPKAPALPTFIDLALNTGCRKHELLTLTWSDVDLDGRRMTLQGSNTKNGRRRVLPLNRKAIAALRERAAFRDRYCPEAKHVFCRQGGSPYADLVKSFREACRRAAIEDFRIHDLRHTFASWLVMKGVRLIVVRDLLGHSSVKMTERYAHLAQESLVNAVALLDD